MVRPLAKVDFEEGVGSGMVLIERMGGRGVESRKVCFGKGG